MKDAFQSGIIHLHLLVDLVSAAQCYLIKTLFLLSVLPVLLFGVLGIRSVYNQPVYGVGLILTRCVWMALLYSRATRLAHFLASLSRLCSSDVPLSFCSCITCERKYDDAVQQRYQRFTILKDL